MPFTIKQHDLRPYLTGQILMPNELPMDLATATQGFFIMRKQGETAPLFRKAVSFIDPEEGRFQYAWESGDTDEAGSFDAEVEILWGTEPQTFPVDSYYRVIVVDDLDNP